MKEFTRESENGASACKIKGRAGLPTGAVYACKLAILLRTSEREDRYLLDTHSCVASRVLYTRRVTGTTAELAAPLLCDLLSKVDNYLFRTPQLQIVCAATSLVRTPKEFTVPAREAQPLRNRSLNVRRYDR